LEALGFAKSDAIAALEKSGGSVEAAADLLEQEEEDKEEESRLVRELSESGDWSLEAAASALKETDRDITAAGALLADEERSIITQFEAATADMLANGWDEVVARQALLAQYTIDQRRANGQNTTTSREALDSIRPTLKKQQQQQQQQQQGAAAATAGGGASANNKAISPPPPAAAAGNNNNNNKPRPARKEDCVFEVTAANFQTVVLESPVPVLVDVYADWCGPCQQLGPILEDAAINSGGMFRLAKVNSDNERSISEALNVKGLPTVYSVNAGKFTDRFVGMLPQQQLQQYLVRCVTGQGGRVQAHEVSDEDLEESTRKMVGLAGLASVSFKKREKLLALVDEAVAMEGAMEPAADTDNSSSSSSSSTGVVSQGLKVALLYINNAAKDVRDPRVSSISTQSKAFTNLVAPNPAAMRLLEVAGFRLRPAAGAGAGTETSAGPAVAGAGTLTLLHSNAAILTMVAQRAVDTLNSKKFVNLKRSAVKLGENPSFRAPAGQKGGDGEGAAAVSSSSSTDVKQEKKKKKKHVDTGVPLAYQGASGKHKKRFADEVTLGEALSELLLLYEDEGGDDGGRWNRLEIRHPPPRKIITPSSEELSKPLGEWADRGGVVLGLVQSEQGAAAGDDDAIGASLRKKARRLAKKKKRGVVSLRSYDDEKDTKHNESFGGAETITLLGEDSDDDAEVDLGDDDESDY
jgi:thioredoxin